MVSTFLPAPLILCQSIEKLEEQVVHLSVVMEPQLFGGLDIRQSFRFTLLSRAFHTPLSADSVVLSLKDR